MKHLPLFIWLCLSLINFSSLQAQMFGGPSAKWIYGISNISTTGYIETNLIGTTILSNQTVQTYRTTVHEYSLVTRDTQIFQRPNEFMYEENGVLFYYNQQTENFDTLIWFAGIPGDMWEIQSPIDSSEIFTTEIIDTGSLIINSNPLRFLAVSYNGGITDTLVEDIGSLSSSIKPWEKLISESPIFRCYSDDNLGLYQKDPSTDCEVINAPIEERLFGGPNAKWTYERNILDYGGYLEMTIEKDTFIGDFLCQKYQKVIFEKNKLLDFRSYTLEADFLREENSVLYLYNHSTEVFDTLIWFGASLNDTWKIIPPASDSLNNVGDTLYYEVVDTGQITIDGVPKDFQAVEIRRSDWVFQDTLISGIGSINYYFKPWQSLIITTHTSPEANNFRCFFDDSLVFQKDPDIYCDYIPDFTLFGGPGAIWTYARYEYTAPGYVTNTFTGDTLLDGRNAKILSKTATVRYDDGIHSFALYPDFITNDQENNVVYLFDTGSQSFDTLFYWGSGTGASWDLNGPDGEIYTYEVKDVRETRINGQRRFYLAVDILRNSEAYYSDTIYLGIGPVVHSYKPWDYGIGALDGPADANELRCYQDTVLGLYQRNPELACDFIPPAPTLFGGPNAKWTYDRFSFSSRGYTEISVSGDTVINGKTCQIYSKINTRKNCSLNVVQVNELPPDFMYEDGEVLYFYNPDLEIFDTLLWFGASSGDSWELTSPESEFLDTLTYIVTDTGQIVINDIIHPFLEIEITSAMFQDNFTYRDTIVPGIGTLTHFYKSWQIMITQIDGGHDAYSFRCYEDDQIGFYQKDPDIPCDFIHDSAPYGGPGAIWTYNRQLGPFQGYLEVTNVGDTTINDFHLHILQKTAVMQMGENVVYDTLSPTYIHIDHEGVDVIYYFDTSDQSVDTLIWYGANVGDTWELAGPQGFINRYEVIGIGEIDIEGHTKTYQAVNIYTNDVLSYQDTIVHGIGPISKSFLPWDFLFNTLSAPFDAQEFRCYRDDIIGLYQKDPDIDCDFLDTIPQKYFGGPNAKWTFDRFTFCYNGYVEISIEKDTVINDEICQKYVKQVTEKVCSLNILKEYQLPPDFMYEEGEVLYYYNPDLEIFDTLLWFGASIGDTWEIISPNDYIDTNYYEVTNTGTLQINDQETPFLEVRIGSRWFPSQFYTDTLVRGIGSYRYFYKPWQIFVTAVDGDHDGYSFRCYEDDQIGFFQKDLDVPCDFIYNSEAYGGPNAVWTYARNLETFSGYLEVSRLGDTTINDFYLNILRKVAVTQYDQGISYDTLPPTYISPNIPEFGDVVSYFDTSDQTIDTLIWYNAGIGDSWELMGPQGYIHRYEVTGTGEIEIVEGYTRDYLAVDIYTNDALSYQDTIVQGIGPIYYSFLPWDFLSSTLSAPFDAQEFRCYRDDIIGLYQKDPDVDCDLLVNSQQYRPNWDVGFYPNPVRQTLYIDIPESAGEVHFTITSPTGAILDQGIFREAPTIDMGRYPTGLYHIRLISKDKVGILKVIKSD